MKKNPKLNYKQNPMVIVLTIVFIITTAIFYGMDKTTLMRLSLIPAITGMLLVLMRLFGQYIWYLWIEPNMKKCQLHNIPDFEYEVPTYSKCMELKVVSK